MFIRNVDSKLINDYFNWLCELAGLESPIETSNYRFIMKLLYSKEFYSLVPNDDNRGVDGQKLRDRFSEFETYEDYEEIEGPCNVLEMLVALAIRIDEDIMYDVDEGDRSVDWFWLMLKNLGIAPCTDQDYMVHWTPEDVDFVLDKWLDRAYLRNGRGGLFPLKRATRDQRKLEIWYQMGAYFQENY